MQHRVETGKLILRLGIAAVFLWFGFSQIFNGINWVGFVPSWAVNIFHLPPAMIVLGNGFIEVVFGGMLAMGVFIRVSSVLLAVHLLVIAFSLGFNSLGVRDFGLAFSALALFFLHESRSFKDYYR